MVRLLHNALQFPVTRPTLRFNPTMVRLLHRTVLTVAGRFRRFQSHNGAIAAVDGKPYAIWRGVGFNPTMVRLLRFRLLEGFGNSAEFQSHNGAIAAKS
mgnify:CR=1 FL=1